jgi:Leucine-rich repeat (LRR) protein
MSFACLAAPLPAQTFPPLAGGKAAKIPQSELLGKLLALGANVWIKRVTGDVVQVKAATDALGPKYTFARVEFAVQKPDESPLALSDYSLLDSLTDLPELSLSGEVVNDAVLEKLRPFHALRSLRLDGAKLTPAAYNILPALPELRDLQLSNTGTTDEVMKTVCQCRKIQHLQLANLSITDNALALLPQFPALEELELFELDKITTAGFAHLAECRVLRSVYATGFTIFSGMIEHLGQCRKLETVSLPDSVLKDADIAALGGLSKLRALDLNNSLVTAGAFANWMAHGQMTSLNLDNAGLLDDAGCKSLEHAFPRMENISIKLAPSGFTVVGASVFRKLTALQNLRLSGPGVTDEIAAELAHCESLTNLAIPAAQLSEKGIAALAHLPHLSELSIDSPPISDAALKLLNRFKELKIVNIGKDAPAETETELHRTLPKVTVNRPTS